MDGQYLKTKGLKGRIEFLKEKIGDVPLSTITQQLLERVLSAAMSERGGREATYKRYLALISAMINKAGKWGYIERNPGSDVKRFKGNNQRQRYLEDCEVHRLIEACSDDLEPIVVT